MSLKRKKRVLAIDDEPSMTEWLKILLEHAGFEVKTALIGTRALPGHDPPPCTVSRSSM